MKKILLLAIMAITVATSALAIPAKRGFHNMPQADGTTISVEMRGDEWSHSLVTTDGLTVSLQPDGNYYYRTATAVSNVVAHNPADRAQAEAEFVAQTKEDLSMSAFARSSARLKAQIAKAAQKVGSTQVPNNGNVRIPVLLVQYSDKKMSNSKAAFKANFTDLATQYFTDQSNGKFIPQYDLFGIYTLSGTRSTYGGNDYSGNDKGVCKMVGEAVDMATAEGTINWKNYDNDGDNICDVVIVLYAGVGEAQASSVTSAIWPCQWNLASGAQYNDGTGTRTANGVTIDKFAVFNEVNGSSDNATKLDGVGTFCHEFSHCLGLPDFYETTYSNGYYGMGSWSLMDYGSYNNNGYTPIGYNAYEKAFMGWIDLVTPKAGTKYTLPVWNSKSLEKDKAIKITSDINSNEYYLLEYRRQQGWDAYIQDEGILITHVSYIASRWEANTPNNQSVQLMTIAPADNRLTSATESTDLWGESNHDFTDESSPAAKLFLTASGSATGSAGYLGKPVTDITLLGDSATLWYMYEAPQIDAPVITDSTDVTSTSFTAHWTPVEGATSYTLQITDPSKQPAYKLMLDEDLSYGTTTWTKSTSGVYSYDDGYIRLGTSSKQGSITSPSIDISGYGDKVTVVVTGRTYNNDGTAPMKIDLLSGSTTVATTTSSLNGTDATKAFVLDAGSATNVQVKIANTTNRKRLWLSNVKVYAGDASSTLNGAPLKAVTETGDSITRTITGITDTLYNVANLDANGTYIYKVKALGDWGETTWSTEKTITLADSNTGLRGDINHDGKVDVSDVTELVNKVLNLQEIDLAVDDLNGDGVVNVSDVTELVGIIAGE